MFECAEVRDESFNIMSTSHLNHDLVHKITTALKNNHIYYQIYKPWHIYRRS